METIGSSDSKMEIRTSDLGEMQDEAGGRKGAGIKWWCRQSCRRKRKKLCPPCSGTERASGG